MARDGERRARHPQQGRAGATNRRVGRKRQARLRRALMRLVAVLLAGVTVLALGTGGLLLAVPSVANAPDLVSAYLQANHGIILPSPPPTRVAASVTAIEDHFVGAPPGVDIAYGATRYLWTHLVLGRPNQGGSTIAQQLAKRLYTGARTGLGAKIEELGLALKLEFTYTSSQLLSMYLNDDYFGQDAYGIDQAASAYFGRSPSQLSWAQAAMLGGLVQAPSAYDPFVHPKTARLRQLEVIGELRAIGTLTPLQAVVVEQQPLGLVQPAPGTRSG